MAHTRLVDMEDTTNDIPTTGDEPVTSDEQPTAEAEDHPAAVESTSPIPLERERPKRRPLVSRTLIAILLGGASLIALALALATWYVSGIGIPVPDVTGVQEGVARARLAQAGLEVSTVERRFDVEPEGTVLSQNPRHGARLPRGGTVALVVSGGTEEFRMPDVIGMGINVARAQLEQSGLVVKIEAVDSDQPSDTVLETIPAPGALVRTSDIVRVRIAAEGSASQALLPFALQSSVFVIDPVPAEGTDVDPALEVSRRLRSLLEASGAQVIVTRSVAESQTPVAARAQKVSQAGGSVTAFIGLEIVDESPAGIGLLVPREGVQPDAQVTASVELADALLGNLAELDQSVTEGVLGSDPVVAATSAPAVRIRLGALASREDVAAFRDPSWSDTIARAIYRALGTEFSGP